MVDPIPDTYPRVTPYLYIDGAAEALDFYREVLGASERMRMDAPDGGIGHAEVAIGDSVIMLADEAPHMGAHSPRAVGGTPVGLHVYVEDVDVVFARALEAGASEIHPVSDQFYGDRSGTFEDPFGHRWHVATHVEDVTEEQVAERAAAAMEQMSGGED